ncbi:putative RNA-directed DNA polymerase from transposon X-element [Trichonephila clavipes]|nr:putative RNA-directed DNA polymerase from transposon X-element [Trichonephila clavipes]
MTVGEKSKNISCNGPHCRAEVVKVMVHLETFFALGRASILCGDFNAPHLTWGGKYNSQRGTLLNYFIDNIDTELLAPPTPTRFGYGSASTISFALIINVNWPTQISSILELRSDRNPLILNFDTSTRFNFPTRNVTTNWEHFRDNLNHTIKFTPFTANTSEDIENQVADLTDKILNAHNIASKPINPDHKQYASEELKSLFIQRNRSRKA